MPPFKEGDIVFLPEDRPIRANVVISSNAEFIYAMTFSLGGDDGAAPQYQLQRLLHTLAVSRLTLPDATTRYFRYAMQWFLEHSNTYFLGFRDWLATEAGDLALDDDKDEEWQSDEEIERQEVLDALAADEAEVAVMDRQRTISWPPPPSGEREPGEVLHHPPHASAQVGPEFYVDVVVRGCKLRIRERVCEQDAFELFEELERFVTHKKEAIRGFDTMTGEVMIVREMLDGFLYGMHQGKHRGKRR